MYMSFIACPSGSYGYACEGVCLCQNDGKCAHKDGRCTCKPGFRGQHCDKGKHIKLTKDNIFWFSQWFLICP